MDATVNGKPTVSVVMPVYNSARFLREAIDSVLAQSFTDFELVLVDDGSTDGSAAIMDGYSDPRIRVVKQDRNRGLVAALNTGLDHAHGTFIARMDGDDVMVPQRLAVQVRFLEDHPAVAVVAAFVDLINEDGAVTGVWNTDREAVTEEEIRALMPKTACIAHPTVMIRRDALAGLRYDPRQVEGEDWDLWLRMLSRGFRIAKIPEALLLYRQHPASFTGTNKSRRVLELRLLAMRRRFLLGEWGALRFNRLHLDLLLAQVRSLARHVRSNLLPPLIRSTYRILTYSLFRMLREQRALQRTLTDWKGHHLFLFPYMGVGGAELVHTGIAASVTDLEPLIIITGFSKDRAFEDRFTKSGTVLEIPRLLNHPWTRKATHRAIAQKLNHRSDAVLLGALTPAFFDMLPLLKGEVRTYFMQHAFLFQPAANLQHKRWLKFYDRVNGYVLTSGMAKKEFDKFLFHHGIPASRATKLIATPSAAPVFGEVRDHARTGVLFVGRDSPEKRLDLFLRITNQLESMASGKFRFTVAGAELRPGYPHVVFKGIIRDPDAMSAVYADHDVFVLTSTREGHCLVVTEAMANGLVVVSTPVGDVPGRVDGSTGFLTSTIKDATVLKETVDAVIFVENDHLLMRRLKEAAIARIRKDYDPEEFRRVYRALLTRPTS